MRRDSPPLIAFIFYNSATNTPQYTQTQQYQATAAAAPASDSERDTQREREDGRLGYSGARRRWCGSKPP